MTCEAKLSHSGRMICLKCVTHWYANDPDPPECKKPKRAKKVFPDPPVLALTRKGKPFKDRLDHIRILKPHEIENQPADIRAIVLDYITAHPAWGYDFQRKTWVNHGQ